MKQSNTISEDDDKLFQVTDSIEEAINIIKEQSILKYKLKPHKKIKPWSWLQEGTK